MADFELSNQIKYKSSSQRQIESVTLYYAHKKSPAGVAAWRCVRKMQKYCIY